MKTIVSPLLFLALFFSILMPNVAEADEGNMCYIYVETSKDAENGIPKDRLAWVDSVFQRFGVKSYFLSFPQAKTESLKNIYEIHAEGNTLQLYELLKKSDVFKKNYLQEYYQIACSSPVSYNDPFYINGSYQSRWQLDMIEAECAWSNPITYEKRISTAICILQCSCFSIKRPG